MVAMAACTIMNGWYSPPFGIRITLTTDENAIAGMRKIGRVAHAASGNHRPQQVPGLHHREQEHDRAERDAERADGVDPARQDRQQHPHRDERGDHGGDGTRDGRAQPSCGRRDRAGPRPSPVPIPSSVGIDIQLRTSVAVPSVCVQPRPRPLAPADDTDHQRGADRRASPPWSRPRGRCRPTSARGPCRRIRVQVGRES